MPEPATSPSSAMKPFVEMVEALSNRHGQVDIRLERFSVKLPFGGEIELTGAMSVSVHLRELTERERKAHEGRQLHALSA
jgi:hypothetical protein